MLPSFSNLGLEPPWQPFNAWNHHTIRKGQRSAGISQERLACCAWLPERNFSHHQSDVQRSESELNPRSSLPRTQNSERHIPSRHSRHSDSNEEPRDNGFSENRSSPWAKQAHLANLNEKPPALNHVVSAPEHRKKTNAGRKNKPNDPESEAAKRKKWEEVERVQGDLNRFQKTSITLTGKPIRCSICGEEGHNRRSCPKLDENAEGGEKTKKIKRLTFAEMEALRGKRREARKNRPKSRFKGLSWSTTKGTWSVQVWDKSQGRTKNVGYFNEEEEGARAYDQAILKMRGVEAELNFPDEVEIPKVAQAFENSNQSPVPFPSNDEECVKEAVKSILRAWKAGVRRQRLEYILPVDPDGGSVSVRQEFQAIRDLMEATLLQLKQEPDFSGRVSAQWLDKSDFVAAWQSETLASVVFCNADCLPELKNIDGGEFGNRLILLVNPQWQTDGQIISDFGIGRSRLEAEKFVSLFQPTFSMQRKRILGDNVRVLKTFDSKWQVHYVWPNRKGQLLIGAESSIPTYETLLELLRRVPGSKSSQTWVERVLNPLAGADIVPAEIPQGLDNNIADKTPHQNSAISEEVSVLKPDVKMDLQPKNNIVGDESLKLRRKPRLESNRSDRFAEDKSSRDLRHDTVMSLPEWPRQLLGNAFGKERVDDREGIVRASNKQKRKPHTKQVKETQVNPKTDQETESWVEEDDEKIENPPKSHMQGNSSALS